MNFRLALWVCGSVCGLAAAPPAAFRRHEVAQGLKGGYQVVAADMNRDGRADLIALASGMKELVWYENPSWQRHVIAEGFSRMINLAAWDSDGDGIPEIVLAHAFANNPRSSLGVLSLLRHGAGAAGLWSVTEIDRLPSSHRLRWAAIDGEGKVLVNAPLAGGSAAPPDYRGHTPLVYYRPGEWKRRLVGEENEGVVHGIATADWDGDGRDDILTASFLGLHVHRFARSGRWIRESLAAGDPAAWPKSGSSDVAVGAAAGRYLAAIEPWHGHQVAIYRQGGSQWRRQVIDSSLAGGHTILTADLNGDGADEVIAGYRGPGQSVNIYYAADGGAWTMRKLDAGGMAASSCAAADLNGDKRLDIACIGSATANLKWYENLGPERGPGE